MNDAVRPRAASRFDKLPELLPDLDGRAFGTLTWADLYTPPEAEGGDEVALAARLYRNADGALTLPVDGEVFDADEPQPDAQDGARGERQVSTPHDAAPALAGAIEAPPAQHVADGAVQQPADAAAAQLAPWRSVAAGAGRHRGERSADVLAHAAPTTVDARELGVAGQASRDASIGGGETAAIVPRANEPLPAGREGDRPSVGRPEAVHGAGHEHIAAAQRHADAAQDHAGVVQQRAGVIQQRADIVQQHVDAPGQQADSTPQQVDAAVQPVDAGAPRVDVPRPADVGQAAPMPLQRVHVDAPPPIAAARPPSPQAGEAASAPPEPDAHPGVPPKPLPALAVEPRPERPRGALADAAPETAPESPSAATAAALVPGASGSPPERAIGESAHDARVNEGGAEASPHGARVLDAPEPHAEPRDTPIVPVQRGHAESAPLAMRTPAQAGPATDHTREEDTPLDTADGADVGASRSGPAPGSPVVEAASSQDAGRALPGRVVEASAAHGARIVEGPAAARLDPGDSPIVPLQRAQIGLASHDTREYFEAPLATDSSIYQSAAPDFGDSSDDAARSVAGESPSIPSRAASVSTPSDGNRRGDAPVGDVNTISQRPSSDAPEASSPGLAAGSPDAAPVSFPDRAQATTADVVRDLEGAAEADAGPGDTPIVPLRRVPVELAPHETRESSAPSPQQSAAAPARLVAASSPPRATSESSANVPAERGAPSNVHSGFDDTAVVRPQHADRRGAERQGGANGDEAAPARIAGLEGVAERHVRGEVRAALHAVPVVVPRGARRENMPQDAEAYAEAGSDDGHDAGVPRPSSARAAATPGPGSEASPDRAIGARVSADSFAHEPVAAGRAELDDTPILPLQRVHIDAPPPTTGIFGERLTETPPAVAATSQRYEPGAHAESSTRPAPVPSGGVDRDAAAADRSTGGALPPRAVGVASPLSPQGAFDERATLGTQDSVVAVVPLQHVPAGAHRERAAEQVIAAASESNAAAAPERARGVAGMPDSAPRTADRAAPPPPPLQRVAADRYSRGPASDASQPPDRATAAEDAAGRHAFSISTGRAPEAANAAASPAGFEGIAPAAPVVPLQRVLAAAEASHRIEIEGPAVGPVVTPSTPAAAHKRTVSHAPVDAAGVLRASAPHSGEADRAEGLPRTTAGGAAGPETPSGVTPIVPARERVGDAGGDAASERGGAVTDVAATGSGTAARLQNAAAGPIEQVANVAGDRVTAPLAHMPAAASPLQLATTNTPRGGVVPAPVVRSENASPERDRTRAASVVTAGREARGIERPDDAPLQRASTAAPRAPRVPGPQPENVRIVPALQHEIAAVGDAAAVRSAAAVPDAAEALSPARRPVESLRASEEHSSHAVPPLSFAQKPSRVEAPPSRPVSRTNIVAASATRSEPAAPHRDVTSTGGPDAGPLQRVAAAASHVLAGTATPARVHSSAATSAPSPPPQPPQTRAPAASPQTVPSVTGTAAPQLPAARVERGDARAGEPPPAPNASDRARLQIAPARTATASPLNPSGASADEREREQIVRVNIGRIRVEAPASSTQPAKAPFQRPRPRLSIDEYARRRGGAP